MSNYLSIDRDKSLDLSPNKEVFARLTVLTHDEQPLESFESKIQGGSLNIDGNSIVRRTCSLQLAPPRNGETITDAYWALSHKFKLETGVRTNNINDPIPQIKWYKQGIFCINSFSKSQGVNSISISISGQDKMSQLNGTFGGMFPYEIDFGTIQEVDINGNLVQHNLPIRDIITRAIHEYGKEPYHNIIINDLPEYGYELLEYQGKNPMYMIVKANAEQTRLIEVANVTLSPEKDGVVYYKANEKDTNLTGIRINQVPQFWTLNPKFNNFNKKATPIYYTKTSEDARYVIEIKHGDTVGYRQTSLTYAGSLVCKAGDNLTTLLNKIKEQLVYFEYFYDVDGHFVFQKKKTYVEEIFSPASGDLIAPLVTTSPYAYTFQDQKAIISISHSPAIDKIKNDFVYWGKTATSYGNTQDIHVRYAIDKKPIKYTSPWPHYEKIVNMHLLCECTKLDESRYSVNWTGKIYNDMSSEQEVFGKINRTATVNGLTKSAAEYLSKNYGEIKVGKPFYKILTIQPSSFEVIINSSKRSIDIAIYNKDNVLTSIFDHQSPYSNLCIHTKNEDIVIKNKTKIQDYTQIVMKLGDNTEFNSDTYDWREILYRMSEDYYNHNQESNFLYLIAIKNIDQKTGQSLYPNGTTGYEQYYTDILAFWRQLYNPFDTINCYTETDSQDLSIKYWQKSLYYNQGFKFWFDFLDVGEAPLGQYAVPKINQRQLVQTISNSNSAIFVNTTPDVLFYYASDIIASPEGKALIWLSDELDKMIKVSSQGVSLIEYVNDSIAKQAFASENISLSVLPIYSFQPNVRIYVEGIGDLIVNSLSFSLGHNATMSMNCTKPIPRLY